MANFNVINYYRAYIVEYRRVYEQLVSIGFPRVSISPYLDWGPIHFWQGSDGSILFVEAAGPSPDWWLYRGPALVPFREGTVLPETTRQRIGSMGSGEQSGIIELAVGDVPEDAWLGEPGEVTLCAVENIEDLSFHLLATSHPLDHLQRCLTFGAFGGTGLDIKAPTPHHPFWNPRLVYGFGFVTGDRERHRFLRYAEIGISVEAAAWDYRAIAVRAMHDVRRDFAAYLGYLGQGSRSVMTFAQEPWEISFRGQLSRLSQSIEEFQRLLDVETIESVFHRYLIEHPELLDIYATAISKPRFVYPAGSSPLGKEYVEPDIILDFGRDAYTFVELERPNKPAATTAGHPRSELTQASFQIAEWRNFVRRHYEVVKDRFPNISADSPGIVVMSRLTTDHFASHDPSQWRTILRDQFKGIEFLTYDDVVSRSRQMYARLATL